MLASPKSLSRKSISHNAPLCLCVQDNIRSPWKLCIATTLSNQDHLTLGFFGTFNVQYGVCPCSTYSSRAPSFAVPSLITPSSSHVDMQPFRQNSPFSDRVLSIGFGWSSSNHRRKGLLESMMSNYVAIVPRRGATTSKPSQRRVYPGVGFEMRRALYGCRQNGASTSAERISSCTSAKYILWLQCLCTWHHTSYPYTEQHRNQPFLFWYSLELEVGAIFKKSGLRATGARHWPSLEL